MWMLAYCQSWWWIGLSWLPSLPFGELELYQLCDKVLHTQRRPAQPAVEPLVELTAFPANQNQQDQEDQ